MFYTTPFADFSAADPTRYVPIVRERAADLITPVGAAARLFKPGEPSFLLESAEGGETIGRYSLIGTSPTAEIGPQWRRPRRPARVLDAHQVVPIDSPGALPAGAVGYLGYDAIRLWEDVPQQHGPASVPMYLFHHFKDLIVFDHLKQRLFLITLIEPGARDQRDYDEAIARLEDIRARLNAEVKLPPMVVDSEPHTVSPDAETFMANVRQAKEHIVAGDIFQVVIARTFSKRYTGSPLHLYRALRMVNPSPFMFYLEMGDHQVIGASPEDLVRVKGDRVETLPIAGTRRRGATPEEDDALAADLLADPKEIAEHTMLVDLARNDIGRISQPGTVTVERMMEVEKFSHVIHLVSRVVGKLNPETDALAALCSCSPAGTLSGAPKIRAMEIIDSLEERSRGVYGGAVAYFDGRGDLDSCIAIRTLVLQDELATVTAGAGIVADSHPASEEEETRNKAAAVLTALAVAGELV